MFGFGNQFHPDLASLLHRCQTSDNASPANNATVIEFLRFINWHYVVGLRDTTGNSHIIRECAIAFTASFSRQKLWWIDGNPSSMANVVANQSPVFFNNQTRYGWDVTARSRAFDTGCRASQFSANSCSMTIAYAWNGDTRQTHVGTASNTRTSRWLYHPAFKLSTSTNRETYYDCANDTQGDGRLFVNRPTTDIVGIHVATKNNNVAAIYFNGSSLGTRSDMNTNRSFPNRNIHVNDGSGNDSIGGFSLGTNIVSTIVPDYNERWRTLMITINPARLST